MTHAARLRQIADTDNVKLYPLLARDLRRAADRLDELEAEVEELTESLANVRGDLDYAISDRRWNRGGKS